MRIAFHGKGGSGKTTTAAGFAKYLASFLPFVLAVDADLNAHLQGSLDLPGEPKQLGMHFDEIVDYLRGNRLDLGDRPMIGNVPPSMHSRFIKVTPNDPFLREYALFQGNIALLTVGGYELEDVASTCYHEKLKSMIGLFHHMLDDVDDVVVSDSIAGTDNIATSLSFAFDLNIFVVEPTVKSLRVYQDYAALVPQYADRLFVIGNKVADSEDANFLRQNIPPSIYLGSIQFSKKLKHFEQGSLEALQEFQDEQSETFKKVYETLKKTKRDWSQYLKLLRDTYKRDCERWYSEFYKSDLTENIDQTFTYEAVLKRPAATAKSYAKQEV